MNFMSIDDVCIDLEKVSYFYLNKERKRLYIHFDNEKCTYVDVPESCDTIIKCIDYFGISFDI